MRKQHSPAPVRYDKRAKRYVGRAVRIAGDLVKLDPDNVEYRRLLGRCHSSFGALERNYGETGTAVNSLNNAIGIFRSLSEEFPDNQDYQYQIAVTLMLMPTDGKDAISFDQIEEVQSIANALVDRIPNPEYVQLKIVSRLKMADFQLASERPEKAAEELKEAASLLKASDLKGPAMVSMLNAVIRTVRTTAKSLPYGQRPQFVNGVRSSLRKEMERYVPRWIRRGQGR